MNFQLPPLTRKRALRTIASLQEQSAASRAYFSGRSTGPYASQRKLSTVDLQPTTCQWIEGEPKDRMFCGEPNQHGSSYCQTHHRRCYTKVLTPDEE